MMAADNGLERVRSLFKIRSGAPLPDELREWPPTVFLASVIGFLFGGFLGARWAGDKYIAMNHNTKFTHTMQAQRELHGAAMLGFVRQGAKWGWKMGVFAGLFSGCNILLSVYRDKEDALNIIVAGGITGMLFRVRYGVKPAIGGYVLGTLLSVPVGVIVQGVNMLLVNTKEREMIRQKRYEARIKRDMEWSKRLEIIEGVVESLESDLQEGPNDSSLRNYYSINTSNKQK